MFETTNVCKALPLPREWKDSKECATANISIELEIASGQTQDIWNEIFMVSRCETGTQHRLHVICRNEGAKVNPTPRSIFNERNTGSTGK